jgi:outer membrane immunogenic protein
MPCILFGTRPLRLRNFALIALAMIVITANAVAAEPVAPMPYAPAVGLPTAGLDWTGAYGGLHGGYLLNNADSAAGRGSFLAGGQAGYNYQVGGTTASAVFGVELDGSYLWRPSSRPGDAATIGAQWLGAAKLRYGVALGRWLPFATAGLAVRHIDRSSGSVGGHVLQLGGLFGGGVEYALSDRISIMAEYDYLLLGKMPEDDRLPPLAKRNLSGHLFKAGVNFHFPARE